MINKKIPNKYSYSINPSRTMINLWLKFWGNTVGNQKKKKKQTNKLSIKTNT